MLYHIRDLVKQAEQELGALQRIHNNTYTNKVFFKVHIDFEVIIK